MYLGKPHTIERDGDDATGYSNMIFIVNPQTHEILDYITLDNVIDDNHKLNLETYLQTYDAIVFGGGRYDKYLEKRNRVIIPDEDGTLQEFVLFEVDKYRDTEGRKTHFYAHASYLELKKANIIYPNKYESLTASQLGGIALNNTGWQIGIVEATGTRTLTIENHTSPYEFIKRIAREFEVELRFRVETDGQRITGRYVDMLERIGEWRGRQVEFGRDLDGIRRIEKQDIVTALLGLGPEQEDGTRLEVLVEDEDALQRWGRVDEHGNLHHLIEPYEIESSRSEMTETEARQYTRTALDKRINTQVGYETTVVDLEEVPGMSNKKIRFGDTLQIKDTHFNPPLYLEARVYEMTRSLKHKAKKDIKLGDYIEYTEEEVNAVWNQLRNEIRKKVSMAQVREYAEPKIIESPTPPPIEQGENAKWIDTSGEIKVPHVVVGDEWVKMSQTEAQEVGTYDANTHDDKASDASLLNKGIVDVGQVPLRTSVSGARIEWDGVNGLVQYDANNDVVTHLSLDGDATFSGDITGSDITASTYYIASESSYGSGIMIDGWRGFLNDNSITKQGVQTRAYGQINFESYGDGEQFPYLELGYYRGAPLYNFDRSDFKNKVTLSHFKMKHEYGTGIGHYSIPYFTFDMEDARFTGSLKLENASGTSNALEFPSGHMISTSPTSEDFTFYGNRAGGRKPFVLRTHSNASNFRSDLYVETDGTLYSTPTYNTTSSNAANVRIGIDERGESRFLRTSSAKKYKHDIQLSDVDPYKILDLDIKSWYDKREYEENGESTDGLRRYHALVADDVADLLPEFADYNHEGEVENYNDRVFSLLIPIVKDILERLDNLESN